MSLLNLGNFLGDVITQTGHAVTEITSSTAHSISGIASNIVSNIHIDARPPTFST
ncbi:hypothetical protein [Methylobacterium dankookense]|uniref:Uncharacterized protein n=1 Tax=Methylobacterium dankookense TaxID=560405 RepID=A0A564G0K6_9HYPH|nr:hypothetical protein [Methylobacterium dankookense]GJD54566.1 hypothetical protein IFDJLNFL_0440 [Methylobacterium dankookense]VUF13478.1 hypothetical protein MTDSW087_03181 [Methylobacterium dankookense]